MSEDTFSPKVGSAHTPIAVPALGNAEPFGALYNSSLPIGASAVAAQDQTKDIAASKDAQGIGRVFQSLQERDFLFLWLGTLGSFMALNMQQIARGYLAYDLTGSATALGAVTMAWGLPMLVFSLLGGVVADRFSKRSVLIATQALMGITTLINAVLVSMHVIEIWHLVVLGLFQGLVFAFNMPARQALVPALVGRDKMANAIALNNAGMNLTRIVGPAIAGLLIAVPTVGVAGVFYAIAGCYLLALAMLFQIPSNRGRGQALKGTIAQEMQSGLRYIGRSPTLLALLIISFVVVLLAMPYQALMPLFALRVFQVGSEGLGVFMGTTGVGALVGSLMVAYFSSSSRLWLLQAAAGTGFGLTLLVFALAPGYAMALVAIFLVGATANVFMSLNNTLIMVNTESAMHGRVMSVYMMTFAVMPLAALPMSMLADVIGAPLTIAGAGALTALVITAVSLRSGVFGRTSMLQET